LQQEEPFLSVLSAWNIRANSSSKAHPRYNIHCLFCLKFNLFIKLILFISVPDGVRLPRGILLYNTGKKNENVLSSKDLELTTITLVPSELEYRAGKSIAVNGLYICYAVKGNKNYSFFYFSLKVYDIFKNLSVCFFLIYRWKNTSYKYFIW